VIYGIGVDLVTIARFTDLIARFGDKTAKKILADNEYAVYSLRDKKAEFLASRFAAKEACVKALGTGFRDGLSLRHIAIVSDDIGKPVLHLDHQAKRLALSLGVNRCHVTISHEREHVVAMVVLEA